MNVITAICIMVGLMLATKVSFTDTVLLVSVRNLSINKEKVKLYW